MYSQFTRTCCLFLAIVIAWLPVTHATAGMIDTESAISVAQHQDNRERVAQFLSRDDVKSQLETLGVSPSAAVERVNLMSAAEVQQLAGQVNTAPAGAIGGLIVIVLLGILVWFLVIK